MSKGGASIIGKRFGKVVVKERDTITKSRFIVVCDCGNKQKISGKILISENFQGECTKCKKEKEKKQELEGYIGKIYNNWKILDIPKKIKGKIGRYVTVECLSCGQKKDNIRLENIYSGISTQCKDCSLNKFSEKYFDLQKEKIGKKFNMLTIIDVINNRDEKNKGEGNNLFLCRCNCGNIKKISAYRVTNGEIKSCGCLLNKTPSHANRLEDLIGEVNGKLTLIGEDIEYNNNRNKSKQVKKYLFECDCGKRRIISTTLSDFRRGFVSSCGCLKSKQQIEIGEFLTSLGLEFSENNKSLGFEIDFLIPSINLGIEYNGVYWHQLTREMEEKDKKNRKKGYTKAKHNRKKIDAYKEGINLIYIWEDEWTQKKDIVESMIKNKVGLSKKIYARKCNVVEIDQKTYNEFCEANHIQGKTSSTRYRYGLIYDGKLMSVMGFDYMHELNRFCTLLGYNVIGGFTKLLKHHIKRKNPKQITSFADYDVVKIDDNIYSKNSFCKEGVPELSYFYVKSKENKLIRYHKSLFRKDRIRKKHNYIFDKRETEYDAMENLGYYRCYKSGIQKYVLDVNTGNC